MVRYLVTPLWSGLPTRSPDRPTVSTSGGTDGFSVLLSIPEDSFVESSVLRKQQEDYCSPVAESLEKLGTASLGQTGLQAAAYHPSPSPFPCVSVPP